MILLKVAIVCQIETKFTGVIATLPSTDEIALSWANSTICFQLFQAPCTILLDQIIWADHEEQSSLL